MPRLPTTADPELPNANPRQVLSPIPKLNDAMHKVKSESENFTASAPSGRGAAAFGKTVLVIDVLSFAANGVASICWNADKSQIDEDMIYAEKVIDNINQALLEQMIPQQYINMKDITHIANVILFGVNNSEDPGIYKIAMEIYRKNNPEYVPPACPADATTTAPPITPILIKQ
jgi:hypothetical protein